MNQRETAMAAVNAMKTLARDVRIRDFLREFGSREEHVQELALGVMKVTRLLDINPREVSILDAEDIYSRVL